MALADCGLGEGLRLISIVGAPLIVAAYGGVVYLTLRSTPTEELKRLVWLFTLTAALGALIMLTGVVVSGWDSFLDRLWISLGVAAVLGVLAAPAARAASVGRSLLVALCGDVVVPGIVAFALYWFFVLIGAPCLGA